jgi:hemerythrin
MDEQSAFLPWTDDFVLGHEQLDREHRALCELINRFADALDEPAGWEASAAIATELVHEARRHFDAEEALMRQASYPELARHHEQHTELLAHLESVIERLAGEHYLARPYQAVNFIGDWFSLHVAHSDRAFVDFLAR